MSLSPSASFVLLYNAALQDYTTQTGTNLVDHPFAKQLQNCESVDSISSLLQENVRIFREFRTEDGKIIKSFKCAVNVLYTLSNSTVLGASIGLVRPMVFPFHIPDTYSIAIPTCKCGICCICNITRGKCLSATLIPISLRLSRALGGKGC